VSGFNERFRFYRYRGAQFFKAHKDGSYERSEAEASFLTILIYLNDDFTGGHTDFAWESIKPRAGSALVFPHRQMHQGSAVESGTKYVLRTDIMYRAPEDAVPQAA
jgi:predicted 2-oxoglutarate/Fe(II)-dependent dioxygenase YbiX